MKTKIFTLLLIATLFVANAQQNPLPVTDFTPNYVRMVPTDSWDGNSNAWNYFAYYEWTSQSAGFEDANVAAGQGLTAKILLPPGIARITMGHNDEYLAGSQCVRYRIIGEYDITDNGPSLITADNDSDWDYGCGSFNLYSTSGQGYTRTSDISTEKYLLIAYFNDGNDLGWPLNFQDFDVSWYKGDLPSDTLLFYNWVNGITSSVNQVNKNNTSLNIFPNPAQNYLKISVNNKQLNNTIQVLDLTGKIIKQFKIDNPTLTINIEDIPNGIYFIKTGSTVKKFIKK